MAVVKFPCCYLQIAAVLLGALTVAAPASADPSLPCQLKIRGHSIKCFTLIGKNGGAGVRFDTPDETVHLAAGTYRVESVELTGNYTLVPSADDRKAWFEVTPKGPNELVVGAPLYATVSARRHGGFVEMDYDTVDGAGRSYRKSYDTYEDRPPEPTFTVSVDGQQIDLGKFEYG